MNVATGVAEPLMAGLVVAAGGLAAAFASAAAGAGAYMVALRPLLSQTQDTMKAQAALDKARTSAQASYTAAIAGGASVKTADAARTRAMTAAQQKYDAAVKGTPAPVRQFAAAVTAAKNSYTKWADSLARPVLGPLSMGLKLLNPVLTAITPLVRVSAGAFGMLVTEISRKVSAGGLTAIVNTLLPHVRDTILDLGHAAGNVAAGIWGILKAFMPVSGQITGGVVKMTALFKNWAKSLPEHTGFQSLMATFKTETPLAVQVLKNLGTVILNVGKAMTGLAGVGNSKSLLQLLIPLSGVLASLSKNTALDRLALYLIAATTAANKLGPAFTGVKTAALFFPNLWKDIVKFAAVTEGATAAEVIAAAATRAWGLAMTALPWVALAAAVVAVAVLIIKYHTQIWSFMRRVWNDILGFISRVWHWVQGNWPLLLAILTGPVGLAIRWITQNFGLITGAVKAVLSAVSVAWNATWNTLKGAFRSLVVDFILTPLGWIVHAAATAFGWVPGLGGKLKTAARAFDQFKADVNKALGGINGRTVAVSVAMTSSTNPYPGGISGRKAAGGPIRGPGGPRDDRAGLFALSNNEWVIRADSAARYGHAAMAAVNEGRAFIGYAAGGGVGVKATAPSYKTVEASLMASVTKLAVAFAKTATAAAGGPGGPGGGAGVARWASVILQALKLIGQPASWLNTVERRMNQESGGNPTIVNKWDSNWLAGHPSVGLMQVIRGTFQAYAGKFRNTGPFLYGVSVNPLANTYAGLNYAMHQYGSLSALNRPGGYDSGGWLMPGWTMAWNGTGQRERVTPPGGDAMLDELRLLRAELRQLTGVAAAIPASTGRHVAGAVGGAGADAAFRRRYPGR